MVVSVEGRLTATLPPYIERKLNDRIGRGASVGHQSGSGVKPPLELLLQRTGDGPVVAGCSPIQHAIVVRYVKGEAAPANDKPVAVNWKFGSKTAKAGAIPAFSLVQPSGQGMTLISSTSKVRVAFGGTAAPAPRLP